MTPTQVIGATGTIGSHVVDELLRRGSPVRAFVRDRAQATVLDGRAEPAETLENLATNLFGDGGE